VTKNHPSDANVYFSALLYANSDKTRVEKSFR
jgi:hypothetical protein